MASRTHYWRFPTLTLLSLLLLLCCWLHMPEEAQARPSWTLPTISFLKKFREQSQCDDDSDLMELCQRCAKATKSDRAYPMCCADEENAINWCKDYIYFGIQ